MHASFVDQVVTINSGIGGSGSSSRPAAVGAAELPADGVDGRVGPEVPEEAVPVEGQRRRRRPPPPRLLCGHRVIRRHVARRRRGTPPLDPHGRASRVSSSAMAAAGGLEHGVLEQRVLAVPRGAALRRAAEQEEVLQPPFPAAPAAAAPHQGRASARRRGRG